MKSLYDYILESSNTFVEIKSLSELEKIIKDVHTTTNREDPKKGTGFWLFKEGLDKDKRAYGNIGKEPWYINYAALKEGNTICGLVGYSLKKGNEQFTDLSPNLYINDLQTLKGYKGKLKLYIQYLTDIAHKNKAKYLVLQCYEKGLIDVYSGVDFKQYNTKSDNVYYMYKEI